MSRNTMRQVDRGRELHLELRQLMDGLDAINHQLAVINGLCEIAKLKAESGAKLDRRMDVALDTVAETAELVQQLELVTRQISQRQNGL